MLKIDTITFEKMQFKVQKSEISPS